MHAHTCQQVVVARLVASLPEGKLNLVVSQVDVIVYGENGLSLNVGEGEEAVVETVALHAHHLHVRIDHTHMETTPTQRKQLTLGKVVFFLW